MPLNLRNISQPPHRKPEKLPPQRPRDALPNTRLPHPRRADETYDLPLDRPAQLAHREELEDTVFDGFEAVVVRVEDGAGVC